MKFMIEEDNRINIITSQRDRLRSTWREIRDEKLKLKGSLLEKGLSLTEIRRERIYRKLKKEQKDCSKRIRHLEREINRIRSFRSSLIKKQE
jgi:hypothetical protein